MPCRQFIFACLIAVAGPAAAQEGTPSAIEVCDECSVRVAEPAAAGAEAGVTPLLSYRRIDDAGVNPLRASASAPTAAVAVEPAVAEPAIGEPRYATPAAATSEPPRFGTVVQTSGTAPFVPATPLPIAAASAPATVTPPPVAPLDDYHAAPLATYDAGATREAISTAAPLPARSDDGTNRRLAPPSFGPGRSSSDGGTRRKSSSLFAPALSQFKSLSSAGAGLAVVVGLFLLCMWLLRRNGPKPSGVLPEGAFAVLGRAPLTANSFAQLLRIGNKLVLVAMSADGAQPLAEVTDPAEVDRLAGLCVSGRSSGSSAEFQQVLAQLSKEPARGFLGREGSSARRRA